jgi:hypothetical protein
MMRGEAECQKYEETTIVWTTSGSDSRNGSDTPRFYAKTFVATSTVGQQKEEEKKIAIPRRNYYNPQGTVQDPSLHPYHDAFYILLDAYDCFYR